MNEPEAIPNVPNNCPKCGAPLPASGLAGLCPACLLAQVANETGPSPEGPGFVPPTVAELAALFPQLEIISLIGKGGMGAVYQARQPALDRIVALKVLPSRTDTGADFAERFNREARALAKLNHPNIVTVHEFGQVNGMPYFLMEYVDGMNLRQLEQAGKLSPREALQIVPQICEALQFAHDAGIVHRDIKPDNILLDKKGRVKIADFGIAKIMGTPPETGVPETQGAIGTPNYMAPEQIEKPQTVDHRADIFSLGVVFYEMLTGELPLGKFAPPSSGPRGLRVDVRLDDVVLRALEKEPDRRYQHASQVKTAVETIAGTPPGTPPGGGGFGGFAAPAPSSGPAPEAILARDYTLDIDSCLRRGWALMRAHFWELVGIHALIMLLLVIADSAFARISEIGNNRTSDGTSILCLLLTGPLLAGLFLYFLKTIRGEPTTVETAFAGFSKRFLHLFLANLVASCLIALGFVCLFVPGVYLLVAWCFTLVLVIDKGLEFWPAMELSRKVVNKHWWKAGIFLLVLAGVWLLGLPACCIGILISAPTAMAMFLYAYEDIFGNAAPTATPAGLPPVAGVGSSSPPNPARAAKPAAPAGPARTVVFPPAPMASRQSGGTNRGLKYALLALATLAVIAIVTVPLIIFMSFRHVSHRSFRVYTTPPSFVPAAPAPDAATAAFDDLVERVRQELDKVSCKFDKLQVSSSGDDNLDIAFVGLQESSIVDGTNAWQDVFGSLTGARTDGGRWEFRSQHQMPRVRFDMADMDLNQVLAGAGMREQQAAAGAGTPAAPNSHDALADRLEAAKTIVDGTIKDNALKGLVKDAASAGDEEIVTGALAQMEEVDRQDEATHEAALLLAKGGHRKLAIEIAKNISNTSVRDQALAELAQ